MGRRTDDRDGDPLAEELTPAQQWLADESERLAEARIAIEKGLRRMYGAVAVLAVVIIAVGAAVYFENRARQQDTDKAFAAVRAVAHASCESQNSQRAAERRSRRRTVRLLRDLSGRLHIARPGLAPFIGSAKHEQRALRRIDCGRRVGKIPLG